MNQARRRFEGISKTFVGMMNDRLLVALQRDGEFQEQESWRAIMEGDAGGSGPYGQRQDPLRERVGSTFLCVIFLGWQRRAMDDGRRATKTLRLAEVSQACCISGLHAIVAMQPLSCSTRPLLLCRPG